MVLWEMYEKLQHDPSLATAEKQLFIEKVLNFHVVHEGIGCKKIKFQVCLVHEYVNSIWLSKKKIKRVGCFWRFWIQQNDPKSVSLASWYPLRNLTACPLKIDLLPTKGKVSSSSSINFQGPKMVPCLKLPFSAPELGELESMKTTYFSGAVWCSFQGPIASTGLVYLPTLIQ